jgi:hypothetical protein
MNKDNNQFLYLGRWVSKDNFRVFVYNSESQKLVNSYDEFKIAIESGLWFASKDDIEPKEIIPIKRGRKPKDA